MGSESEKSRHELDDEAAGHTSGKPENPVVHEVPAGEIEEAIAALPARQPTPEEFQQSERDRANAVLPEGTLFHPGVEKLRVPGQQKKYKKTE